MKKIISLVKACMTSDMSLFKINLKRKSKISKILIILFLVFAFMMSTGSYAWMILEQLAPHNMQFVVLPLFVFIISIMTLIEGIYKSGNLLFNCKDDQLLFSLPIDKKYILFIRMFKFYVFELVFNSLFLIPLIVCYVIFTKVGFSFYITSFFMILLLPVIPIVLSCIIGSIITWLSSKFHFKNAAQIIITIIFLLGIFYLSTDVDSFISKIAMHASSINEILTKLYYPAGAYASLAIDFKISDLLLFIFINLSIAIITIYLLSIFYFRVNSNLHSVSVSKKKRIKNGIIKNRGPVWALIKKELNIFFQTPVYIINAGFGVVFFLLLVLMMIFKFNTVLSALASSGVDISYLPNNISIYIVMLVAFAAFTTSITSSMISIEGKNYTILKALPVSSKRVLMAKIYASSLLTIPAFLFGDILLFIKFRLSFIVMLLIILLTILMPLVSHFLGLIMNLKFPKLEFESPTEVVKQSMSSFASLMLDFIILIILMAILYKVMDYNKVLILLVMTLIFAMIDGLLYLYLIKRGTKLYNDLTI